jgi:hypothetical protein
MQEGGEQIDRDGEQNGGIVQIPSDLVVRFQPIDMVDIIL